LSGKEEMMRSTSILTYFFFDASTSAHVSLRRETTTRSQTRCRAFERLLCRRSEHNTTTFLSLARVKMNSLMEFIQRGFLKKTAKIAAKTTYFSLFTRSFVCYKY
jgi:hypothetical protein